MLEWIEMLLFFKFVQRQNILESILIIEAGNVKEDNAEQL